MGKSSHRGRGGRGGQGHQNGRNDYPQQRSRVPEVYQDLKRAMHLKSTASKRGGKSGSRQNSHRYHQQHEDAARNQPRRYSNDPEYEHRRKSSLLGSLKFSKQRKRFRGSITSIYEQNPFVAKLRERRANELGLEHSQLLLEAAEEHEAFQPTVQAPRFGYEKNWNEDDFVIKFITSAEELNALQFRLLQYTDEQQVIGVLRYLFTSDIPIPVGRYISNGAFQISHHLDSLVQAEAPILRLIGLTFYTHNIFRLSTVQELVEFVMSTPPESLAHIRYICLGSNVVRRAPGARERETQECDKLDHDVCYSLRRLPSLQNLYIVLGYDIQDSYYQWITADTWCGTHTNLPSLEYHRLDEETPPEFEVGSSMKKKMQDEDALFLSAFQIRMREKREIRALQMDQS
ncbi:hypothetical protein MMC10_002044 [Thelotrema lepadinum]|nr:hypothetical protein [Thelotrema lepadinum]